MSRADIFREALRLERENKALAARLADVESRLTDAIAKHGEVSRLYGESQARLAEAEATLRKIADHATESPSQAAYWARAFLASDSASVCQHDIRKPGATWSAALSSRCIVCGESWEHPADQPSIAESKMFQGADGNWYTETIITFGAHK